MLLLREVVGNPFRPVAIDPRWRTADVLGLARAIYEERAFDRLPLLADALMDAGCADEQSWRTAAATARTSAAAGSWTWCSARSSGGGPGPAGTWVPGSRIYSPAGWKSR